MFHQRVVARKGLGGRVDVPRRRLEGAQGQPGASQWRGGQAEGGGTPPASFCRRRRAAAAWHAPLLRPARRNACTGATLHCCHSPPQPS